MPIKLKPAPHILMFATSLVLWTSCAKKPVLPEPGVSQKKLSIELDKSYLTTELVDSAIAIWESNGQQTRVVLSKRNDSLVTGINQFTAGSGRLSIQLFSKLRFGNFYLSQWVFNEQATISHNNDLWIAGPKNFFDQHWKPRVQLKDGIGHYAVIALRPDDPYFFVKDVPGNLQSIIVARDYWQTAGGVSHIGGGQWECSFNCKNDKGHIEDTQFFSFLPTQLGTRTWNHIEITVLYAKDQWGGGPVISMTHTL